MQASTGTRFLPRPLAELLLVRRGSLFFSRLLLVSAVAVGRQAHPQARPGAVAALALVAAAVAKIRERWPIKVGMALF